MVKGLGDGYSTIDDHVLYGNDSLTEISDGRYIRTGKMDGGQVMGVSKKKKKRESTAHAKGPRPASWITLAIFGAFCGFGGVAVIVAFFGHIFHKQRGQTSQLGAYRGADINHWVPGLCN